MAEAFTPEDGTGLTSANSFVSVEDADAYFTLRHYAKWNTLDTETKQGALVDATDWIVEKFGALFTAVPLTIEQALPFPGVLAGANVGVPREVQKATFILAADVVEGLPLWNNPAPTDATLIERTTGPLSRKWAAPDVTRLQSTQKQFERVRLVLAPWLPPERVTLRTRRV